MESFIINLRTFIWSKMAVHQCNKVDQFYAVKNLIRDCGLIWTPTRKKNTCLDINSRFRFISDIHSSVHLRFLQENTCSNNVAMANDSNFLIYGYSKSVFYLLLK